MSGPKKIELPQHITLDETKKDLNSIKTQQSIMIENIFCSSKFSGIRLSNGEFWACGNCASVMKEHINKGEQAEPEEEERKGAASRRKIAEEEAKREKAA